MQEPVLAVLGVHPRTLMRAVDVIQIATLSHRDVFLIGTEGRTRTQRDLPAGGYASRRRHNIIVAVAFVELGAFNCGLCLMSVEHNLRGTGHFSAVGREGSNEQNRLHTGTRSCTAV